MSFAKILDELMGKDRNALPGNKKRKEHFTDSDVAFFYYSIGL